MNLRDLEYVTAIADEGHFGRAAARCHVSQSTLSIQIRKLEENLGTQLFERSRKQVMPTAAGDRIIARARLMLREADEIRQIAKDASDPLAGEVALGAFPTLAPYLFPRCLHAMRKQLPKIRLQLVEEKTDRLLDLLDNGRIDCALIAAPVERRGLKSIDLFHEPFTIALSAQHPFAKKKVITDAELAKLPMLLLDEGHCLRAQALDICHAIGIGESSRFRGTSLETLRQMVELGDAVTLMPKLAVRKDTPAVRYIPLQNPAFGRTIALCWREASARGDLFMKLAEAIRKSVK